MTTENFAAVLPQGEALRTYLIQPHISKGDIKNVLRERGVFTCAQDKEQSIPALTLSLIRPSEFSELQQAYTTKEDNPKITTQTIKWKGTDTLLESLPEDINVNRILDLDFENFKVIGAPNFYPVDRDPDTVRMDFTIERLDRSKSWADTRRQFKASIEFKKNKGKDELIIISTYTAPETKFTNTAISKHLIGHLKAKKQIEEAEKIRPIRFADFTNENRFAYLLGLTQHSRLATLSFVEIVDLGLAPDEEKTLPSSLDWMKERIRNLDLRGVALEGSEFLSDATYHPSLHLYRLDAKFQFSTSGLDGDCIISFGFPEYSSASNTESEIELKIKKINFEHIGKGMDKNDAKETILRELEFEKIETYKKLSIPAATA